MTSEELYNTCRKHFPFLSSFMTSQLTLLEHLRSHPVFSEVQVTQSLVLCVCFVDRCLFFCPFSFGHCAVSDYPFGIFKLFL